VPGSVLVTVDPPDFLAELLPQAKNPTEVACPLAHAWAQDVAVLVRVAVGELAAQAAIIQPVIDSIRYTPVD
jgi:hypothetical protein